MKVKADDRKTLIKKNKTQFKIEKKALGFFISFIYSRQKFFDRAFVII